MQCTRPRASSSLIVTGLVLSACSQPGPAPDGRISGDPPLASWTLPSPVPERVFVIVHGGPGVSHSYLRPDFDRLAEWGEVVFYDQRGCGGTPPASTYSPSDFVEDLNRVVEAVRPGRQVILVGSSWGSYVIGWYLRSHGDRVDGVILSGTRGNSRGDMNGRLVSCPETTRRIDEAARDAWGVDRGLWTDPGLLYTTAYVLQFKDRGDGMTAATPVMTEDRRMEMPMPGHDPWLSDPEHYFAAVGTFVGLLESESK
jgi:pimeloyl-ACP methyl ester carboxylesterase